MGRIKAISVHNANMRHIPPHIAELSRDTIPFGKGRWGGQRYEYNRRKRTWRYMTYYLPYTAAKYLRETDHHVRDMSRYPPYLR